MESDVGDRGSVQPEHRWSFVEAIHAAVPGRARYKVAGLHRSEALKELLEQQLNELDGVEHISANPLTGHVLVVFDAKQSVECIAARIEALVRDGSLSTRSIVNVGNGDAAEGRDQTEGAACRNSIVPREPARTPTVSAEEPWHLMEPGAVLATWQTSPNRGLSAQEVDERQRIHGLNTLPEAEGRSQLSILFDQLSTWPVAMLSAAAGISVVTGGLADAVAILGVVAINAAIGYFTESKSENTLRSLNSLIKPPATVVRDGKLLDIPAEEVVAGDLLILTPGVYVGADSRLVEANNLSVDESALTGESMPASKRTAALARDVPLPDRTNMVYRGTLVTGGQGLAVVVAIGRRTEIGRIQILAGETQAPDTPLERQLAHLGNQLVVLSGAVCGLVFGIGLIRGYGFVDMLKISISLAVAAIPEGLPTVATTTLALGILNMRRHHVVIRHLDAVESLGCIQTICLDKTGTLTLNRMTAVAVHCGMRRVQITEGRFFDGARPLDPSAHDALVKLAEVCVLCSETTIQEQDGQYVLKGTPTENALVHMGMRVGLDVRRLRDEYPVVKVARRSGDRNVMSTVHECRIRSADGGAPPVLVAVKGSPSEVLAMCRWYRNGGDRAPLSEDDRAAIEAENERMAGDALRVLGCAVGQAGLDDGMAEDALTWLGLVGMADPIRDGVKDVIAEFHHAGIDTVMITGDQSPTAYAIGRDLALSRHRPLKILDSTDLGNVDPAVMNAVARRVHIYARVSPSNKLEIVQALQHAGRVVAMTGDGINDGPALKAADIGIAMGSTGTDVAREVADVVLEDDNLETMLVAISQGRTVYRNIRKSLHFLLSTNLSEIMVMFTALATGLGQPLNAMQLLWINLISDIFPGLALALEPPEADVMRQPPRDPDEPVVRTSDFTRIASESAALTVGALGAYGYGLARYGAGAQAMTLAFTTLTGGQLVHAISCRSETHSVFSATSLPKNPYLIAALTGSFAAQGLTLVVPALRQLLGLAPLAISDTLAIAGGILLPFVVNETTKPASEEQGPDAGRR